MGYFYEDDEYTHDIYDIHNFDIDGWPGDFVHGPDVYLDDEYMDERWKPIVDFPWPDYWISNKGRVWSNRTQKFMYGTPTGRCGHLDVSFVYGGRRYHRYIHCLVARAFIPNPNGYKLVRHLDDNPDNNWVENLAWGTQLNNVQDCINNGRFRYFTPEDIELANQKRRVQVVAVEIKTGREFEFISQAEAARRLNINQSDISSVLLGKRQHVSGYYFYRPGERPDIDFNNYRYSRRNALIRAIDIDTGEIFVFRGQTEAANELNMSIASVSNVLSGKVPQAKGYIFEYVEEEECDYGSY